VLNGHIRVLVVDDHAIVRGALTERLQREHGISVAGTAATGDEAIRQAAECRPDVVLMDIDMPGVLCFDAAQTILSLVPEARLVFLSGFVSDRYIEQALAVCARGYLVKRESLDTVVDAVREVAAGGVAFSDDVHARLVVDGHHARLAEPGPRTRVNTLTPRESEVLIYLARGLAKKEIGGLMHISTKTVDHHTVQIMNKLEIHDRVELARFAIREGMLLA
jgi:DNA-binding NarL/FixJ family response regulator